MEVQDSTSLPTASHQVAWIVGRGLGECQCILVSVILKSH